MGSNVWDGLVARNPDTGELVPNVATAWRWIDDRTLELDLREGVRFHNGERFGADDVVYTGKTGQTGSIQLQVPSGPPRRLAPTGRMYGSTLFL